jgi:hypothetical protein
MNDEKIKIPTQAGFSERRVRQFFKLGQRARIEYISINPPGPGEIDGRYSGMSKDGKEILLDVEWSSSAGSSGVHVSHIPRIMVDGLVREQPGGVQLLRSRGNPRYHAPEFFK